MLIIHLSHSELAVRGTVTPLPKSWDGKWRKKMILKNTVGICRTHSPGNELFHLHRLIDYKTMEILHPNRSTQVYWLISFLQSFPTDPNCIWFMKLNWNYSTQGIVWLCSFSFQISSCNRSLETLCVHCMLYDKDWGWATSCCCSAMVFPTLFHL